MVASYSLLPHKQKFNSNLLLTVNWWITTGRGIWNAFFVIARYVKRDTFTPTELALMEEGALPFSYEFSLLRARKLFPCENILRENSNGTVFLHRKFHPYKLYKHLLTLTIVV